MSQETETEIKERKKDWYMKDTDERYDRVNEKVIEGITNTFPSYTSIKK